MFDFGFKGYATLAIVAVLGLSAGYVAVRYFAMSSELSEVKATLVQQEAENARLVDISNRNAEAAKRADEDRRAAVEALEFVQYGLEVNSKTSRLAEVAIEAATEAEDGPVATVLERLRASRFGGSK